MVAGEGAGHPVGPIVTVGQDFRRRLVDSDVAVTEAYAVRTRRRPFLAPLLAALVVLAAVAVSAPAGAATATYSFKRLSSPARTQVFSVKTGKLVATFTDGTRTVNLVGPSRTFAEPTYTTATVTTTAWVRLLSAPFTGTVDQRWLTARLGDTSPDVLALSMQYIVGAPAIVSGGLQIAGDAAYGPLLSDGTRGEGSDFNDYLGVTWTYSSSSDAPEVDQFRSLDCSGFIRMVLGYRAGLRLTLSPDGGVSLPRRAFEQAASAPGILVIPNTGVVPSSRAALAPGDLVFFDADSGDGTQIDHVGMFLGRDSGGSDRFISSRKSANGPTIGDLSGRSVLNGTGYYATAFRAARRV